MSARTLLYDIETAPNLGYVWGMYEQNVVRFHTQWHMLSVAWKWLGDSRVHVRGLNDYPLLYDQDKTNDKSLAETVHGLFNEADIVVAHNGNSFDQKKAQARMLVHGFEPPAPYKQIDTKLVARRYFNFNSNKLEDLGITLGLGKKLPTGGFDTWLGCMSGDPAAWAKMKKYNKQDVVLLEKVYLKMSPWIVNGPHSGILDGCPKPGCGKGPLIKRGFAKTKTMTYQQWQCQECGGYSRSRLSKLYADRPDFV